MIREPQKEDQLVGSYPTARARPKTKAPDPRVRHVHRYPYKASSPHLRFRHTSVCFHMKKGEEKMAQSSRVRGRCAEVVLTPSLRGHSDAPREPRPSFFRQIVIMFPTNVR